MRMGDDSTAGHHRSSGASVNATVSDVQLASVLDTAVDGIIVIDDNAMILMFNKACERMFGYQAAEVVGRNVAMLMSAEDAARHDHIRSRYRPPASVGSSETVARFAAGGTTALFLRVSSLSGRPSPRRGDNSSGSCGTLRRAWTMSGG